MHLRNGELRFSPSDLNDFLACEHLTHLEMLAAAEDIARERSLRPEAALVRARGERHEQRFRERLATEGREIVDTGGRSLPEGVRQTIEAMRGGADVVYQAAFYDEGWTGYADFLIRVDQESPLLGPHSYEAYDTKLAKHPKPYFVLQLFFYTEQVARIQGRVPRAMHIVLGDRQVASFRPQEFAAYVRRVRARFLEYLGEDAEPPYPYPVDHCDYCDWWKRCRDRRRDDDNTTLVAGLGRPQAIKLDRGGVPTMRGLAALGDDARIPRLAATTLAGLREQARLQVHTDGSGEHLRTFLPLEEKRGFLRMPARCPGDVFFDIEGDPFWGDDGLEYLLGTWTADEGYTAVWAHDEAQERAALECWIEWVGERLERFPELHVYHYNHYEPTALKRLMGKYGVCEGELDDLLRREVFVDLYAVVRQAIRVGEPGYSLKNLEVFYPLERDAAVTEAGGSILAYQEYLESSDEAQLNAIADYNADDCRSTHALREWLRDIRSDAEAEFGTVLPDRDMTPARQLTPEGEEHARALATLKADLLAGIADADAPDLPPDEHGRRLLADLLDYHRREAKPAWWTYFDRLTKSPDDLCDEDTEAIGNLAPADDLPVTEDGRSFVYPLRFPAQQHKIGPTRNVDPDAETGVNVIDVDDGSGLVRIRRDRRLDDRPLPRSIIPGTPYNTDAQRDALMRLGDRVRADGLEPVGRLDASVDLLMRRGPRTGEVPFDAPTLHRVAALDSSYLFIQGPPGAGKTHTGARLIRNLVAAGHRVGVTATSHKAIRNLLDEVEAACAETGLDFAGLKKRSGSAGSESDYSAPHVRSSNSNADFPRDVDGAPQLIAGTAWLFAREEMEHAVDWLFIDEAGQVSLADALALSQAARNVVLLGDPQQLAQVSQGTHPRGSGVSVLEHLLAGAQTVAPEDGVFLEHSWRMHPAVCAFVSETMYDGRLGSVERCARQDMRSGGELTGTGLRMCELDHEANRQNAPEEADWIAARIQELHAGGRVTDQDGLERDLDLDDILVVAPYNAQVRCLKATLPDGARVGTVDKFQGQEAPVVFFSMTSSSGEDVPRGMEFLFSRNRLNVAISRAQCLAVVVCSPKLLTTRCNTVEQMRLVNAVCRFAEVAAP